MGVIVLADSAMTISWPWIRVSQTGASGTVIMALAFLQALIPKLKLKSDTLVTGMCDLRGVLQSISGLKGKTSNMQGTQFKFLVVPTINKQAGRSNICQGIELLPAAHMGEVLYHMVEGIHTAGKTY